MYTYADTLCVTRRSSHAAPFLNFFFNWIKTDFKSRKWTHLLTVKETTAMSQRTPRACA